MMTKDDLVILYEDNHIIVVEKPQNMPTCEDESKDPDLLNLVKTYLKETYHKAGEAFCGMVHRLDRPTGGVMVFAKTSKAASRLTEQMKTGDFEKKYLTVVVGSPKKEKATLTNYLKKNAITNQVYLCAETTEGAKKAELSYRVLEDKGAYSLLEVTLHTGRSHQIRVQMAGIGNPVFGDLKYGGEKAVKGNLALYAYSLKFTHPVTKERLVFMLEPPKDLIPWRAFNVTKYMTPTK